VSESTPTLPVEVPDLHKSLMKLKVESRLKTCVIKVDSVEKAKTLLKHYNTTNRPLSKSQYKVYANEMLRGKWRLNGEPFIFGIDDETKQESAISLQHRLHGLIEAIETHAKSPEDYPDAQLEIEVAVVYNVPIETADTVDQGMLRKHGHVLYRDEWIAEVIPEEWCNNNSRKAKWCNALAGAARLVWLRAGGATVSSAPKFIVSEMLEFIKTDHKKLCEFVSAVLSACEEEGAGLKISPPYIAALCYIASLTEDGICVKTIQNTVLDAMLKIAQNDVKPGTAEHALVTYWNKLFSTPGSKDRDIDIVGPFVKALNAIIADESVTASKLKLTTKEAESYATQPPLLKGWDESCFIYAAEVKSELKEKAEVARAELDEKREAAKAAREEEKAAKAEEKAKAKAEAEAAKAVMEPGVKPGVMTAMKKAAKAPLHPDVSASPSKFIKRKPTAVKPK
jgi:hypothetical protein